MRKVLVSWSSGKDSAWALHQLRQAGEYEIAGLLTTVNAAFDRVAMHGTRREILEAQADAVGVALWTVPLPWHCSNAEYEAAMSDACRRAVVEGIEAIAFGDLFLEDVRRYREERLAGTGLAPIFPLWGMNTVALVRTMLHAGVRARIVCVDPKKLPREFAGRDLDESLLEQFSPDIDPCAENGEFHTCAYAGPMFHKPIAIESGDVVERDGFVFADVKLAPEAVGASGASGR
ncbi:adenine nucleotide alpha hydrolase [Alloacidobacterium dinghuense]|uniref:Adenine nucleotide alpha hydrolase n=1 Tax=Alloacidobacterium dinghuense TaxID=2763107 RepID=A0A7G8BI50_9BACT|nr:adenine nucleotide alpha hydrolase [Alloacidobacterium dinghuense]QNI32220.1 adenine nucleotide alpha hydrolase [Alloacidobacterium dinghuense]